jgi:tetratricopeptide (TPR) repeat protein
VEATRANIANALGLIGTIAEIDPAYEPMLALRCELLTRENDWPELDAQASVWTRAHPGSTEAWRNLSRAAFELGRYRAALDAFRQVVALSGKNAQVLTTFARIALHAQEFEIAATALAGAESLDPNFPELLATRALLLTYLGRFREAEACCRRCLQVDANFAPAYTTLSRLIKGRFTDPEMRVLEQLAKQGSRPLDHRIAAAFALAHAHDSRQETAIAFDAYRYAHELCIERNRREGRAYEPQRVEARVKQLISAFPAPVESTEPPAAGQPVPVFIVGMPRSGTTLVESMLSAHSRVRAGGERPQMQQILEDFLRRSAGGVRHWPESAVIDAWRRAYFRDLPAGGAADRITDKHPLNFHSAGLILRLFPAAVVIHIRRNPLETALSIYRNEFSKFWMFTDRLEDIGHYYGQYARLVAHWERILAGRFLTVQYEEFAGNFEAAAPVLVRACGLDWEEQCRDFQKATRPISTFSAVQAREAVSVRRGAADRYRAHLGPLIDALQAAGVDLRTGALAARGTVA